MRQKHISVSALLAFLWIMAFSSPEIHAQCKSFVKNNCLPQLVPYLHDGSYQAVIMSEGEEAEVFKTVFAGQQYRLIICTENALPDVDIIVSDIRRTILFDNRKNGNVKVWDFKSDVSQQIKVTIRISKSNRQSAGKEEPIYGCVAVLFGILEQ